MNYIPWADMLLCVGTRLSAVSVLVACLACHPVLTEPAAERVRTANKGEVQRHFLISSLFLCAPTPASSSTSLVDQMEDLQGIISHYCLLGVSAKVACRSIWGISVTILLLWLWFIINVITIAHFGYLSLSYFCDKYCIITNNGDIIIWILLEHFVFWLLRGLI